MGRDDAAYLKRRIFPIHYRLKYYIKSKKDPDSRNIERDITSINELNFMETDGDVFEVEGVICGEKSAPFLEHVKTYCLKCFKQVQLITDYSKKRKFPSKKYFCECSNPDTANVIGLGARILDDNLMIYGYFYQELVEELLGTPLVELEKSMRANKIIFDDGKLVFEESQNDKELIESLLKRLEGKKIIVKGRTLPIGGLPNWDLVVYSFEFIT